jgi:hypothetical protein
MSKLSDIIRDKFEECSILGCDAVYSGREFKMFRRNLLTSSSGHKIVRDGLLYPEEGGRTFLRNV